MNQTREYYRHRGHFKRCQQEYASLKRLHALGSATSSALAMAKDRRDGARRDLLASMR